MIYVRRAGWSSKDIADKRDLRLLRSNFGGKELSFKLAPIYYDPAIFADQESAKKNIHHFETSENTVLLELTPTRIRST